MLYPQSAKTPLNQRTMRPNDLQAAIINWTVKNSGFEDHRAYIGLSGIGDCEQVIYDRYFGGQFATIGDHLMCRLGYDLEHKLIERLGDLGMYTPGETIELFNGLVQGHTDGRIGEALLEIKTLEREDWLPRDGRIPRRHYQQVQAYLHYTQREFAYMVYLARDHGCVTVEGIRRNATVGTSIAEKVQRLVDAVHNHQRPECSCGKCK